MQAVTRGGRAGRRARRPAHTAPRQFRPRPAAPARAAGAATEEMSSLPEAELADLQARFQGALKPGEAELHWEEVRDVLECGQTFCLSRHVLGEKEVGEIVKQYDEDGSGGISFAEFQHLAGDKLLLETKLVEFEKFFRTLDTAGHIGRTEVAKVLEGAGAPVSGRDLDRVVDQYGTDGRLDLAEFLVMSRVYAKEVEDIVGFMKRNALAGREKKKPSALERLMGKKEKGEGVVLVQSEQEVDAALASTDGLVVLEVAFTWCRPCKGFEKKYERFAVSRRGEGGAPGRAQLGGTDASARQDYYTKVKFLKVYGNENVSSRRRLAGKGSEGAGG